nr:tyrosine-type recombinase/integrase [Haloarchaeobius litoreus]
MSPRQARDRFLDDVSHNRTERTIESYRYRLRQFVLYCEENQIESVREIDGWVLDEYKRTLSDNAPATIKGKMMAVKQLVDYLARIEAVDSELPDKVDIPYPSKDDRVNKQKLDPEEAILLIENYRDDMALYGTVEHALLEILWFTGARMGSVQALDLGDFNAEDGVLWFRHRPDSGTRLKNGSDGERPVGIPDETVSVLQAWIRRDRPDTRDDHGRNPLLACRQGRPSTSTVRNWCYMGTQPCLRKLCPHGQERKACEYTKRNYASQCPSSRSPHQVRTGSVTWQLNRGIDIEDVADRVNATPAVIREHYDVATGVEKLEERREKYQDTLSLEDDK